MELIRGLINLQHQPVDCVATIGNFDGIHAGHQAIVAKVIAQAKSLSLPSCVLLFEPHPKEFFMVDRCPPRLTCFREKYNQLKVLGVDRLIVLQFNQSMREVSAENFVNQILVKKLRVKHLVVGDDFHFGHQRQGNYQLLEKMAVNQFTLEPTPSVMVGNERVSSTLIRSVLATNQFDKTVQLLGRRYTMTGKVGFGKQLGQTIDFPTANVAIKRKKVAVTGVFLVKAHWLQNNTKQFAWGAANCGKRPTVAGSCYHLEVHLFDVNHSFYGIELVVEFYEFIRDEQKFAGLSELKKQIAEDVKVAKQMIKQKQSLDH